MIEDYNYEIKTIPSELSFLIVDLPQTAIERLTEYINSGNFAASDYCKLLQDEGNWFFDNYLKFMCDDYLLKLNNDTSFARDWGSAKGYPFKLSHMWWNKMASTQFIQPHTHNGIFSFNIFMKIPTKWKEQHSLNMDIAGKAPTNTTMESDFFFGYINGLGEHRTYNIGMHPKMEGKLLFFDSRLSHGVYPFYNCEEDRISISGNIVYDVEKHK